MRFGVREICDVVFKPLSSVDIGGQHFDAFQPILYFDTAKTSSLEQAVTTVYAQGGRGNPRLIGWDGEKQVTFTFEDALMSPTSFALLSGAGIIKGKRKTDTKHSEPIYVHTTYDTVVEKIGDSLVAPLTADDRNNAQLVVSREAPVYPVVLDSAGSLEYYLSAVTASQVKYIGEDGNSLDDADISVRGLVGGELELDKDSNSYKNNATNKTIAFVLGGVGDPDTTNPDTPGDSRQDETVHVGDTVRIDCYEAHYDEAYEMQIAADEFPGYYYIEADTLFRDEATGVDLPAEFIIPRGKVQGNFTFTMANSGDPSTFTFTIDCFPAYTKFNRKKKVQAVLQVIDQTDSTHNYLDKDIIGHGAPDDKPGRTKDSDFNEWYEASIFSQEEDTKASAPSGAKPNRVTPSTTA